jgi:hypothetical protein
MLVKQALEIVISQAHQRIQDFCDDNANNPDEGEQIKVLQEALKISEKFETEYYNCGGMDEGKLFEIAKKYVGFQMESGTDPADDLAYYVMWSWQRTPYVMKEDLDVMNEKGGK